MKPTDPVLRIIKVMRLPEESSIMLKRRGLLAQSGFAAAAMVLPWQAMAAPGRYPVQLSDAEWRRRLTPAAYNVLRRDGTERPYSSPLNNQKHAGLFTCAGCGNPLFSSRAKFESGTGWPSFFAPLRGSVGLSSDRTLGITRTEVHCARCGGHLGHVFDDGPKPTGKRYCMNGVAMRFRAA